MSTTAMPLSRAQELAHAGSRPGLFRGRRVHVSLRSGTLAGAHAIRHRRALFLAFGLNAAPRIGVALHSRPGSISSIFERMESAPLLRANALASSS
jgi:hypothetical protein